MSILDDAKETLEGLKELRKDIKKEDTERINKQNLRARSEGLSKSYFSTIAPRLKRLDFISIEIFKIYDENFTRLLKLSSPNNRKSSYLETIELLLKKFKEEIIIPLSTHPENAVSKGFDSLFGDLGNIPEKEYLAEAIGCAEAGYKRGAAVLGWSAAIYRFHSIIEKIGFSSFNLASARIAGETQGRFKRYNKKFNLTDRNDLNEVFDTDILYVMEAMGLIDMNEHTRLRSCFDIRCQAAHPCEAPITDYNLLSFFSDINEIVFKNVKYKI